MSLGRVKKRNPNDTTFRNINALKKRVKKLEDRMKKIERHYGLR